MGDCPFPWLGPAHVARTRVKDTLIGKVNQAKEKRSLLPTGRTIRILIWQRLAPIAPRDIDKLHLWEVGGLLNTHMVEQDAAVVAEADRIMVDRVAKVEEFAAKAKDRKKAKRKRR